MSPKSPPPTARQRSRPSSRNRQKPHAYTSSRRHSTARMPFARKVRYSLFLSLLLLLVIIYVTTGPAATRNSAFYQRTVALMDYRAGRAPTPDHKVPEKPIHRAGGLHFAEGDHHLTPAERAAMEQGKLKGEPPIGPDGQPIGLDGEQIPGEMGPVDQSHQRGQRPLIDTDAQLRERLQKAEKQAKKSADDKYRALKDIEDEVRRDRELRGEDVDAPWHGEGARKEEGRKGGGRSEEQEASRKKVVYEGDSEQKPVAERKKTGEHAEAAEPAGRESAVKSEEKEKAAAKDKSSKKKSDADKAKEAAEDTETARLRTFLAEILSKSPVTIFSKTFCPFSMKAKRILLDAYTITPAPYIVELNEHPDGRALQQLLQKTTGRRTVPNVLVNGKSIGGGDETEALWRNGELPARIQQMAGKRVSSVTLNYNFGSDQAKEAVGKPVGPGRVS